jgi:hypothetical protein
MAVLGTMNAVLSKLLRFNMIALQKLVCAALTTPGHGLCMSRAAEGRRAPATATSSAP